MKPTIEATIEYIREECKSDYAEVAIEALEKQIPKKPYMESDGDADGYPVWDYYCVTCNEYFDIYQPKHCWKCGQAIDWSEVE